MTILILFNRPSIWQQYQYHHNIKQIIFSPKCLWTETCTRICLNILEFHSSNGNTSKARKYLSSSWNTFVTDTTRHYCRSTSKRSIRAKLICKKCCSSMTRQFCSMRKLLLFFSLRIFASFASPGSSARLSKSKSKPGSYFAPIKLAPITWSWNYLKGATRLALRHLKVALKGELERIFTLQDEGKVILKLWKHFCHQV